MVKRRKVGNLLALAVLSALAGGIPMHPYQLANVLKRTGKDPEMKIKWGSLYTVVQNLERHGFIEATSSDREGRRPERTTYSITEAGREEMCDWIRELIADPERQHPPFETALSVVGVLGPDETATLLRTRAEALEKSLTADRAALAEVALAVPRLFLIEEEYTLAMREAEARWVRSLLAEMEAGTMAGIAQWRDYQQSGEMAAQWARLVAEEGGPTDGD